MGKKVTDDLTTGAAPGPRCLGVIVSGTLMGRTRRVFKTKEGNSRYLIALAVAIPGTVAMVERWSDQAAPPDLPALGAEVALPVAVRAYVHRGAPHYRLLWGDGDSAAEEF